MVSEMGNRGSERACDWPEVSQRNLAWTQHGSPQKCCPLQGGASVSLSHMPVASLAMKVIGRKLGFLKRVREGDDSGRGQCQLSCFLRPLLPSPHLASSTRRAPSSLLLSTLKAISASPFLGEPGRVTTLPAPLNPGPFVFAVVPHSLPPGPPSALWDQRQEGD